MRVAVVGGGIIGLCSAYYLHQAGADVVLIERGRCGSETSKGNGGWVTPGLSGPLAAPGVMRQAFAWSLRRNSPFSIKPRLDAGLAEWCLRFWRNCSSDRYQNGVRAMLGLNEHTLRLFDELQANGVEYEMGATGLVFAAFSRRALDEPLRELELLNSLGYAADVRELAGDDLRAVEPQLHDRVHAGAHARSERWVRPESLCAGLEQWLRARGVAVIEDAEVAGIRTAGGRLRVVTGQDELPADAVLICAGIWSRELVATLGVKLPLQPAKGYSVTARGEGDAPSHALYFAESKVGTTPFRAGTRISGLLELSGMDNGLDRRRIDSIVAGATRYLRNWRPTDPQLNWAGLRPFAPDGLPIIGRLPGARGLYVATGHGMSGVTLAPATGAFVAPLILEDRLSPVLQPFRADRSF